MPILIRAWFTCYGVENDGDMVDNSILLLTFPYQGKLILPLPGIFQESPRMGSLCRSFSQHIPDRVKKDYHES